MEEYHSFIDRGQIPVFKGHCLTEMDLLLRQHILNIMCKGETTWTLEESRNELFSACLARLAEMEHDGLVNRSENLLQVTIKGKRFLRNICMAFDARLWDKKRDAELFSMSD